MVYSKYDLPLFGQVGPGSTVACFVASEKKALLLHDLLGVSISVETGCY